MFPADASGGVLIGWVLIFGVLIASAIASVVRGVGSAGTALEAIKSIKAALGDGQMLAGRPLAGSLRLTGPVDLVGANLASALLTNPLMLQVSGIVGMVQQARSGASTAAPRQYLTDRLAANWSTGSLASPPGLFSLTEFHARPLAAGPTGDRMLVWFKGRRLEVGSPTLTEYWTFVSTGPAPALPPQCPNCGAPTSGITSYVCPFCSATLWQAPPDAPTYWLVDDISTTPPPELAAAA